jgi:pimeloyl-ACP methyl ester carboxylesterase
MYLLTSRELAKRLPKAEIAQIDAAAHILHIMNPQDFNATVLAFQDKYAG